MGTDSVLYQHPAGERVRPLAGSPRGAFVATVKENRHLCTDHFRLILSLRGFPRNVPGQFVQLDCRDPHAGEQDKVAAQETRSFEWPADATGERPKPCDVDFAAPVAYLRRPFSIADCRAWPDGYTEIDIIHRVVGRGTTLLARLVEGDRLSLIGPLGVGFTVPAGLELACLVGGGVGIPPLLYMAKMLALKRCRYVVSFLGSQRGDLLPVALTGPEPSREGDPLFTVRELIEHQTPAVITTDDGSVGMKGYVTQALRRFLGERQGALGPLKNAVVYCCGPTPMMKATGRVAAEFNVPCQVSLEQPMACGMGTCQSCIIKYRPHEAGETEWKYKLTCTEGPVFDTRDIVW
ncbi:MAG TPA: dihydroorotate dehydrogenase electron transfer subunit [Phycisphaerae bacterium]